MTRKFTFLLLSTVLLKGCFILKIQFSLTHFQKAFLQSKRDKGFINWKESSDRIRKINLLLIYLSMKTDYVQIFVDSSLFLANLRTVF